MIRYLLFILISLLASKCFSQDSKSLKLALKKASHDTVRCRLIHEYISELYDFDDKLKYNLELEKIVDKNLSDNDLNEAERKVFIHHKTNVLNVYGYYYQNAKFPKLELAIKYHLESVKLSREIGDEESIGSSYCNIGFAYEDQGNLRLAIDYYDKALHIFRKHDDKLLEAVVLNNLAYTYQSQKNYDIALKYFFEALEIRKQALDGKEDPNLAMCYNNIGLVYNKTGKLEKSQEYYKKALDIFVRMKHRYGEGLVLNNIGDNYLQRYNKPEKGETGLLDKAMEHFEKSLTIWNEEEDWESKSITLKNIGTVFLNRGDIAKAISYGQESYELAKKVGFPKSLKTSSLLLYDAYERNGDYKNAYFFYKLYHKMDDSITNEENKKQLIERDFEYQYDKKEALMVQKAKANEKRNTIILISTAAIACLILIFIFIWLHFYKKRKTTEALLRQKQLSLDVAESERRRISADLHDDLGSGIAGLAIATGLLAKSRDIDEIRRDAVKIAENSQRVSRRLSEVIWELNMEHDNLEDLLLFIQKQGKDHFSATGINFSMILPLDIPRIEVPGYARRQIYLAVKECFHNIVKHSAADAVRCQAEFNERLSLTISDNGKGFDIASKSGGEGLKNLKYRLAKIDGDADIRSASTGTVITLSMPINTKKITQ